MSYESNRDSQAASSQDVARALQESLSQGVRDAKNHRYKDGEETTNFMGLEMDSALASGLSGVFNTLAGVVTDRLSPKVYGTIQRYGAAKFNLQGATLNRVSAGTALGVNLALILGPRLGPIIQQLNEQHRKTQEFIHTVSPVLDDLQGNHSILAYMTAGKKNEMFEVQMKRTNKINGALNTSSFVSLAVNSGLNVLKQAENAGGLISGKDLRTLRGEKMLAKREADALHAEKLLADPTYTGEGDLFDLSAYKDVFGGTANFGLGPLAEKIAASSVQRVRKSLQPNSAMDLVLELNKQMEGNPEARGFQLPNRGRELPLDRYVEEIFRQHQRDMSDINTNHTEIRSALNDELKAVVAPIAEALRKGEISPLSLVRLVGEGQIIKKHGRLLASVEEVDALLAEASGKAKQYTHVDTKEYFNDIGVTQQEFIKAYKALDASERTAIGMLIPSEVKKLAGMTDKEIAADDALVADQYYKTITEYVIGITDHTDAELKKDGQADHQIKFLRNLRKQIDAKGTAAIAEVEKSPSAKQNLEHAVTGWAISAINGDKAYFGTVVAKGRSELKSMEDGAVAPEERSFAQKAGRGRSAVSDDFDYEDDADIGHAEREDSRRHYGSHHTERH